MHKVWIVDDDSSIRWVLARALRAEGYDVQDFEDAESVLSALEKETPEVLMTDIRMPGISGLELAKQLHVKHTNIPVIVMTAHTDLDSALASYESGAFEYLPKPFDLDEAVRLVSRAVEKRAMLHLTKSLVMTLKLLAKHRRCKKYFGRLDDLLNQT